MDLQQAIDAFALATVNLTEADLERPWDWEEYDEGVRFAFFRTYEELRDLSSRLFAQRLQMGRPRTLAQHCLAQYHAAYQDLRAVTQGVDDALASRAPAEGEWSLRETLVHMLRAERSFFAICHYAVERERAIGRGEPERPPALTDEDWDAFWAASNDPFSGLRDQAPFSILMDYFAGLHQRVLSYFADLSEAELETPSIYWESTPMPLIFRLHRFDSHLRQHTIQMEKCLQTLVGPPGEARRLLRLIYTALAELQGTQIVAAASGIAGYGDAACERLAAEIERRTAEVLAALEDKA